MPQFVGPFSGNAPVGEMTTEELARAIRFAIAAEYEAVQIYQQIAEASPDLEVSEILLDIADEEIVHAGEFLNLLSRIAPGEMDLYEEGYQEVEDEIGA